MPVFAINKTLAAIQLLAQSGTQENAERVAGLIGVSLMPLNNIVEHTTVKGKVIRGIVRTDLTKDQAKEIDPYTFAKNGGWFIREKYLGGTQAQEQEPIAKQEESLPATTQELQQKDTLHRQGVKLEDVLVEWKAKFGSFPPEYETLKADKRDLVFYLTGSIDDLRLRASVRVMGSEPSEFAVAKLKEVIAAQKSGYLKKKVKIKSQVGFIFVKNGIVLTENGVKKLVEIGGDGFQPPEMVDGAGFLNGEIRQSSLAKAFSKWIAAYGDTDNLGTIVSRLVETGVSDIYKIERPTHNENNLALRYFDKKNNKSGFSMQIVASGDWTDLRAYILYLANINLEGMSESELYKTVYGFNRDENKNDFNSINHHPDFVENSHGLINFGEITAQQASVIVRQAGKIRLPIGEHRENGTGYGLIHIEAKHGAQIRGSGFVSVEKFVEYVVGNFQQIWKANVGQLLLQAVDKQKHVMFIQLAPATDGDYYTVNSAFPVRQQDYPERHNMILLWDRSEPISKVTGQQPSAYAATPDVTSSQASPNARGQSNDILADNRKVGKLKDEFNSATNANTSLMDTLALITSLSKKKSEAVAQQLAVAIGVKIKKPSPADFLKGDAVASIKSGQIKRGDDGKVISQAKEWMREYLAKNRPDGVFHHPQLGDVTISMGGVKNSASKMGADIHINAIPAVPYVLENSVLLEQSLDKDGKQLENYILAAPVLIDGQRFYAVVRLTKDLRDQKSKPIFYVVAAELESDSEKEAASALKTYSADENRENIGSKNRLLNVLHNALAVNKEADSENDLKYDLGQLVASTGGNNEDFFIFAKRLGQQSENRFQNDDYLVLGKHFLTMTPTPYSEKMLKPMSVDEFYMPPYPQLKDKALLNARYDYLVNEVSKYVEKRKSSNDKLMLEFDVMSRSDFLALIKIIAIKRFEPKEKPQYDDIGGFTFTPAIALNDTLNAIVALAKNNSQANADKLAKLLGVKLAPKQELDMFGDPIQNNGFDLFGEPIQDGDDSPVEELPRLAIQELPLAKLTLSEDVPQFKSGVEDSDTGVVEALGGKFDRTGVAPIQVWERLDGRLEIISGRHRTDLARRSGEKTIPAQVHKESEGFTAKQAMMLDAELNIRDGQGKVKDYVDYFSHSEISEDEADKRGLLARSIGQRAFMIASKGSEELLTLHRNDIISDQAAADIANIAPNNSAMQAVGLRVLQEHKPLNNALNTIRAVMALTREKGQEPDTFDLFGFDDSALKEAEAMAKVASRKQRQIAEQLTAIKGAVKNPKLAAKHGVIVENEADALAKVKTMTIEKSRWDNWSSHADLLAEVRREINNKLDTVELDEDEYYWLCQEELDLIAA